eukprot:s365_g23.t1
MDPFQELLQECKVSDGNRGRLLQLDFDISSFALLALSLEELEQRAAECDMPDLGPRDLAAWRLLWQKCQKPDTDPAVQPQSSAPLPLDSGWNEAFPPKLSSQVFIDLKTAFARKYPSEILDHDNTPSQRLMALTHQQVKQHHWKFIAWKYRLSERQHEESMMGRPRKLARLEIASIHDLLVDEVPTRDLPANQIGLHQLQQILMLQATALGLCDAAHMHTLKSYVHKFIALATVKFDNDSSLRPPNCAEMQQADRAIWEKIAFLYNEQGWSMDDSIHEFTEIRSDLHSLLQPRPKPVNAPNSDRWCHEQVQNFLREIAATCCLVPACVYQLPCNHKWMFAASMACLLPLAGICEHNMDTDMLDEWLADYPDSLATAIVDLCLPMAQIVLRDHTVAILDLSVEVIRLPEKGWDIGPTSRVDGGGYTSVPDWSRPPHGAQNRLGELRQIWVNYIAQHNLLQCFRQGLATQSAEPFFAPHHITNLRQLTDLWWAAISPGDSALDWTIPADQPYALFALHKLSDFLQDPDSALWTCLQHGVPTGFHNDIPPSNVWHSTEQIAEDHPLQIHLDNWRSAEEDPLLLEQLVQAEVDAGWLQEFPSLDAIQQEWGADVALGKLAIVKADGRKARLVLDSSICNTNNNCNVQEHTECLTLQSVRSAFPLRGRCGPLAGFILDIHAAHKTIRVKHEERGLLALRATNRYFVYKICPFGATFSAFWFSCLGSFLVRAWHELLHIKHALFLFVDDLLLMQEISVLELSAILILCFCLVFGVPLSWHKLRLAGEVTWIGWNFNFYRGSISIPAPKLDKLTALLSAILGHRHVHRRDLHKLLGLLQWFAQLFKHIKPWLQSLYLDLYRPVASSFSIASDQWPTIAAFLTDDLVFHTVPTHTAIRVGSKLLSARHHNLSCKQDLHHVPVGHRRLWLRIADPNSSKRKLTAVSVATLQFLLAWCHALPQELPLRPPELAHIEAAADAMAAGDVAAIGGYIRFAGNIFWFSERFHVIDFKQFNIPMQSEAQKDIISYETLAQLALLVLCARCFGHARLRIRIPSWSDNTATESSVNRMYTSKLPLALFLQKLVFWTSVSGMELDTTRIAGEYNCWSDTLSRWDQSSSLPSDFLPECRHRLGLSELWLAAPAATRHPANASVSWELPQPLYVS